MLKFACGLSREEYRDWVQETRWAFCFVTYQIFPIFYTLKKLFRGSEIIWKRFWRGIAESLALLGCVYLQPLVLFSHPLVSLCGACTTFFWIFFLLLSTAHWLRILRSNFLCWLLPFWEQPYLTPSAISSFQSRCPTLSTFSLWESEKSECLVSLLPHSS